MAYVSPTAGDIDAFIADDKLVHVRKGGKCSTVDTFIFNLVGKDYTHYDL